MSEPSVPRAAFGDREGIDHPEEGADRSEPQGGAGAPDAAANAPTGEDPGNGDSRDDSPVDGDRRGGDPRHGDPRHDEVVDEAVDEVVDDDRRGEDAGPEDPRDDRPADGGRRDEDAADAEPQAESAGAADPAEEPMGVMDPSGEEQGESGPDVRAALEAILMVVDEPIDEVTLAQVLERPRGELAATLRELSQEYTAQGRGFDLREVAGGWRFYTRPECASLVERFVRDGQQTRLTQAALETLAVVAYRQPVSRARVSAIRGVNSDGVMRTLTLRGLIEEAGQDPEHQAILYRTTSYFLERLGLRSLDELPDLAPFLPDDVSDLEEQEP